VSTTSNVICCAKKAGEREVSEATHGGELAGDCCCFWEDETDHPFDADSEVL